MTGPETIGPPCLSLKDEVWIDAAFMVSLKSTVITVSTLTPVAPLAGLRFVIVGGAPACVMLWVRPATVSVPVLDFARVCRTLNDSRTAPCAARRCRRPGDIALGRPGTIALRPYVHTTGFRPSEGNDWLLGVIR